MKLGFNVQYLTPADHIKDVHNISSTYAWEVYLFYFTKKNNSDG